MSANRESVWQPGKLWSLWDMLRNYAFQFAGFADMMRELDGMVGMPPVGPVANALTNRGGRLVERTRILIPALKALCTWVPLPSVEAQIERLADHLNRSPSDAETLPLVTDLRRRLTDDLKRQVFFHVRPEDVAYYNEPMLFGPEVDAVFRTDAADDIEAAGKCLAFRQGTATVFHVMRVLEAGMKRLAKLLGIPYAPSWESYIDQITKRITARHKTKGVQWKRDEPLFRDLIGDLTVIKIAWRNPTMHIVRKYSPDEAEEVFRAARTFMTRLAIHLS